MATQEQNRQRYIEEFKPAYDKWIKLYPRTLENLQGEKWETIPGYAAYQVSNFGRVKSFWKCKAKILKPTLAAGGYLQVTLCGNNKKNNLKLHRLVAEVFIPNPDNKPEVNHLAGRFNNYVGCLEWVTTSENTQHAFDTGLAKGISGAEHCAAKLTDEQVEYIRNNPDDLTGSRLAKKFNVSCGCICGIQRGQSYKNAGGKVRSRRARLPLKISLEDRAKIRELYALGTHSQRKLAKMFGCAKSTIGDIIHEK